MKDILDSKHNDDVFRFYRISHESEWDRVREHKGLKADPQAERYHEARDAIFAHPSIALSYIGRPKFLLEISIPKDKEVKVSLADMSKYEAPKRTKGVIPKKYKKTIVEFDENWRDHNYLQPEVWIHTSNFKIPMEWLRPVHYKPYLSEENYKISLNNKGSFWCEVEDINKKKNTATIRLIGLFKEEDKKLKIENLEGSRWKIAIPRCEIEILNHKKEERDIELYVPKLDNSFLTEGEQKNDPCEIWEEMGYLKKGDLDGKLIYNQKKDLPMILTGNDVTHAIRFEKKYALSDKWRAYVQFRHFRAYCEAKKLDQ